MDKDIIFTMEQLTTIIQLIRDNKNHYAIQSIYKIIIKQNEPFTTTK